MPGDILRGEGVARVATLPEVLFPDVTMEMHAVRRLLRWSRVVALRYHDRPKRASIPVDESAFAESPKVLRKFTRALDLHRSWVKAKLAARWVMGKSDDQAGRDHSIRLLDGQVGLAAVINNEVVGFDLLPEGKLYAQYHSWLVKNYVLEARELSYDSPGETNETVVDDVKAFVQQTSLSREFGLNLLGPYNAFVYRPGLTSGTAMVHEERLVQASFPAIPYRLELLLGSCVYRDGYQFSSVSCRTRKLN
jgi:hypothetical protein